MLRAEGLAKEYGAVTAVRRFDLALPPGRIVGLVGNNGAGKTTTLKMLAGILEPTRGRATLAGRDTLVPNVRAGIGYLPEESPLYEDMTALGYLAFFARLYGLPARRAAADAGRWLEALRLDLPFWTKPIGELSKGSARKVAIARALLHDPEVLILDEPASGLDPATRRELDAVLVDLRKAGKGILLSAHNLKQVEELADDIVLMHQGAIVAQGTLQELRAQWGQVRYRVHATVAFPGSAPEGAVHVGAPESLDKVQEAMAQVQRLGGSVLQVESLPPGLDEILARAAGGST
ncbi:MAG: ABC transporter ATP-binding protein [Thermoplasmatota archaeon]